MRRLRQGKEHGKSGKVRSAVLALGKGKTTEHFLTFDRRLLALALLQSWIFLVFHSALVIPLEQTKFCWVYSTTVVIAVLALVGGIFVHYHRSTRRRTLIFAVAMGIIGTFATHALGHANNMLIQFMGPCGVGLGVGLLYPYVGKMFSSADVKSSTVQTFGGYATATVIYFLVLGIPEMLGVVATALLPIGLLTVVLWPHSAPSSQHAPVAHDVVKEMVSSRPIVTFFVGVALVGVAFGFSLALASTYGVAVFRPSNQWGVLVSGILACAYAAYAFISPRRFDFESYFRPVVPIIVLGLLSMRLSVALASAIIIAGFQLADMLIWIVLSWISSHSGLPQRVFCVGKGSAYVGMFAGSMTATFINPMSTAGPYMETVATIVTFLLLVAVIYIFNNSSVNTAIKISSKNSDQWFIARTIELTCDELSKRYDLTAREKEILGYLARGRTLPYIEADLCIAHGTASAHRDHIYSKLGVHSRQELLDLFASATIEPSASEMSARRSAAT